MATGVLTSRFRDKGENRSTYIEIQRKRGKQEYSHSDTEKTVETGVHTSRYKKKGNISTHIEIQ